MGDLARSASQPAAYRVTTRMKPPALRSCYFGGSPDWERLARVLSHGARLHCAGWDVDVRRIAPPPPTHSLSANKNGNTHKLDWWTAQVEAAEDGTRMLLIDSDTMILGPLDGAWDQDFDFGYTVKQGRFPFNAGVIFVRVSERVRDFMRHWSDENWRMFKDSRYHEPWYRRFGGLNQAALGKMLTEGVNVGMGVKFGTLPCAQWNCEDQSWDAFDPAATRIVHIKSGLRLAALATGEGSMKLMPLVRVWRAMERAAA